MKNKNQHYFHFCFSNLNICQFKNKTIWWLKIVKWLSIGFLDLYPAWSSSSRCCMNEWINEWPQYIWLSYLSIYLSINIVSISRYFFHHRVVVLQHPLHSHFRFFLIFPHIQKYKKLSVNRMKKIHLSRFIIMIFLFFIYLFKKNISVVIKINEIGTLNHVFVFFCWSNIQQQQTMTKREKIQWW